MRTFIKTVLLLALISTGSQMMAQDTTAAKKDSTDFGTIQLKTVKLTFNGVVDVFYGYDINQPDGKSRPGFLYSYNRHNEFNVNFAMLRAKLEHDRVRASVALMAGTYANANLSAEPATLQHVFEANAGLRIAKGLWADAGIFASHIGFESAIGKDNWTLTRSIAADNTPYYLSGLKLTYGINDHWTVGALVCNGWQNIQETAGNSNKAAGTWVTYTNNKVTLNYSTFIGNEKPDTAKQYRVFHNVYGIFKITPKLGLITGFDIGMQQTVAQDSWDVWFNPTLILRYAFTDKLAMAARGEFYHDKQGVIIGTGTPNGFQTFGASLNLDYSPIEYVMLRIESRVFKSKDDIFTWNDGSATSVYPGFTASITASF
ncbi:MAG: porin [Chitinophagales bacterium]|nr:porin [Chitinophagales bacterium]